MNRFKIFLPPFLLAVISVLIVKRWYLDHELIISSDLTFPLRPIYYFTHQLLYQWLLSLNGGIPHTVAPSLLIFHGIVAFLSLFIQNVSQVQLIHYSFWFFLPALTVFFLANYLFEQEKRKYLYTFFVILFYSFNLYRAIMFGDASHMSIYAAEPLLLLFTIKALNKGENYFKYAVFIALSSLVASGAGANPPMYTVFLLPPVFYILVILIESFFKRDFGSRLYSVLRFIGLTISISIFVNIYWILPFLYQYVKTAVSGLNGVNLINWSSGVSGVTSLTNIIRMQGAWDWYSGVGKDPYIPYAANYQNNPILLLLGFLLPILAFTAIYFVRNRLTMFFALITFVGIAFSQGSHPPFGPVYDFLTVHMPLFWMFRSSWYKFSFLVALGYSFLGAVSVVYIYEYLIKQKGKVFNRKSAYMFLSIIIFGTLIYSYSFLDGEKFPKKSVHTILPASHVKVPDYVYKSSDWLNSQKEIFRTFLLPNTPAFMYNWQFNGITDITFYLYNKDQLYRSDQVGTIGQENMIGSLNSQIYDGVYYDNFAKVLRLSGLISARYLIERDDIRYNFYAEYDSPKFVNSQLQKISSLKLARSFGPWHFYKLPDKYFLPLFYVPKTLTYSESDISSLGDIMALNNSRRQAVVFSGFGEENSGIKGLINKYTIMANCVLCSANSLKDAGDKIQMPFVQLLPSSPLYFLVRNNERKQLITLTGLPDRLVDLDLIFADKRLVELSRILGRDRNDNFETLIENQIQRYKNTIQASMEQAGNLSGIQQNETLIKILAHIYTQAKFINSMPDLDKIPQDSITDLSTFISKTVNYIKSSAWMTHKETDKKLIFNLSEDGIYNFTIENSPSYPLKVLIDGKDYTNKKNIRLDKGVYRVELIYPKQENLLAGNISSSGTNIALNYGEKKTFGIKDFNFRNFYMLRFRYRILEGKAPNIILTQDNDQKDWNGNVARKVDGGLNGDGAWHTFEYFLKPNLGAKKAEIEFVSAGFNYSQSMFEIKDFTITHSFVPQVYFTRKIDYEQKQIPYITFKKINPTEYLVHIVNAKKPFILNFGENYDKGWRAYIIQKQEAKDKNENIVTSYFNGQIKELESKNKFIDGNFISTIFAKPINEDNHLKTNGYANGWFIDKKGDYDIIIEYWPQRLFYLGIVISGLSVLIFIYVLALKHKKNDKN